MPDAGQPKVLMIQAGIRSPPDPSPRSADTLNYARESRQMLRAAGGVPTSVEDDALADEEATVGATLGGLNDRERLTRGGIERAAFD